MNLLDAPDAPIWGMIPTRPASAQEKVSRRRLPMAITKPANEEARVIALDKYAILDTDPEQFFDDLTLLASHVCNTPIALISLVDEDRQWFKSRVGLDASETSRDIAFCSTAILQSDVFVIPDALADERFRDNPLVVSDPHIRFYAGAPLINEDGYALGTLCVVDRAPRELAPEQKEALKALSRLVLAQLEFRRNLILLKEALSDRTKEEHERQRELIHVQETLMRVLGLRQVPKSASAR
jgi:GAF domain-containing protein